MGNYLGNAYGDATTQDFCYAVLACPTDAPCAHNLGCVAYACGGDLCYLNLCGTAACLANACLLNFCAIDACLANVQTPKPKNGAAE